MVDHVCLGVKPAQTCRASTEQQHCGRPEGPTGLSDNRFHSLRRADDKLPFSLSTLPYDLSSLISTNNNHTPIATDPNRPQPPKHPRSECQEPIGSMSGPASGARMSTFEGFLPPLPRPGPPHASTSRSNGTSSQRPPNSADSRV